MVSTEHIDLALAEGFQNAPHVCVITGDFVTDQPGKEELLALEKCILKYAKEVPTFACLGNHDGGSWASSHNGFNSPEPIKTC